MGIKKLKEQHKDLSISFIDLLSNLDISKTKKYTSFLIKEFNNRLDEHIRHTILPVSDFGKELNGLLDTNSKIEYLTKRFLIYDVFGEQDIKMFIKFCELSEKGLVKEKDISKYNSFTDIKDSLVEAMYRENFKQSQKKIKTIYDENNYLIFKPLTHQASAYYGYQAKWCTAMIDDPTYFYEHSKGVLIYVIDNNTNQKFGFHRREDLYHYEGDKLFNVFNSLGKNVDTYETGLPIEIIKIIMDEIGTIDTKINSNYLDFDDEELKNMRNYTDIPDLGERTILRPIRLRNTTINHFVNEIQERVPLPLLEDFTNHTPEGYNYKDYED